MLLLNFIFKLVKTLQSKGEPHNIAMGFALGTIIGLTPSRALHNLIVFILILIFNISIPAALFAVFFFSCFAHFFDPLFHSMGYFLLVKTEPLQPVWTYFYNIPIAPLTRFYNTVVLGSLVASLALFFPVYWGFKQIVRLYRGKMADKVNRFKIMQIIKANKLFQMYQRIKLS